MCILVVILGEDEKTSDEDATTCSWCGNLVEEQTYKDGDKVYCSSACHSAGIFPPMVLGTIITTILIVLLLLYPQTVADIILGGFLAGQTWIVIGMYIVVAIVYIIILYITYEGWRKRTGRLDQPSEQDTGVEGISQYD